MPSDLTTLFPCQPAPPLSVPLTGGGSFALSDEQPTACTLITFYRGRHCPACRGYLKSSEGHLEEFSARGVTVIAVSSDNAERAEAAKSDWQLPNLRIGYDPLPKAREWGLFLSAARGKTSLGIEEPPLFPEPGLFLVRSDGTLFFSSVKTLPFARPRFEDVLGAIDFVLKNDYPARGEVVNLREAGG
jgi:peroxiredoxin